MNSLCKDVIGTTAKYGLKYKLRKDGEEDLRSIRGQFEAVFSFDFYPFYVVRKLTLRIKKTITDRPTPFVLQSG